jgi:hypothetical protein
LCSLDRKVFISRIFDLGSASNQKGYKTWIWGHGREEITVKVSGIEEIKEILDNLV